MARVELIAPDTVGERLIRLSLTDPDAPVRAQQPLTINIDYSAVAKLGGVVLPLEATVSSGSSAASWRRVFYRRIIPTTFTFTPVEGGPHVIRVAERFHNRWCGVLRVDVSGERLDPSTLG